jgi:hypothetical protein
MRRIISLAALSVACATTSLSLSTAADNNRRPNDAERTMSLGELTPTADMWFYQQDQRSYHDPREAVRRKAAYRTQQRQLRLAAQQWYGVSNSRPTAASTPFSGGTYGPEFGGGRDPNRWPGRPAATTVIVTPQRF